jgi:hypothetical protein
MTIGLIFDSELRQKANWFAAYGYCALLAVSSVGLVLAGRWNVIIFLVAAVCAAIPGIIEIRLITLSSGTISDNALSPWLRFSQTGFWVVGILGVWTVIRGWRSHFLTQRCPSSEVGKSN